ncbi:hypothetical protein Dsin_024991 [Dipteronia sinensis]|uniref:Uncharacterized protein n=1 Tax=Dipteronia sinensis TaxID=43782 RepID=A0AAE0DWP6_9ROSI|nr:hypothetical protein Dsin_024991 [Dipteronia sinensis]
MRELYLLALRAQLASDDDEASQVGWMRYQTSGEIFSKRKICLGGGGIYTRFTTLWCFSIIGRSSSHFVIFAYRAQLRESHKLIGWRESKKSKPIIVDPGLYLSEKNSNLYASQKWELPRAFRLFTENGTSLLFCLSITDA